MRTKNSLYHIGMHTCARRVGDDNIWATMLSNEVIGEDVLHVAGIEKGVVDVVYLAIHLCILDSLWHIFDADNLASLASHEVGNGAGAGIEVVDKLVACELSKFACHAIKMVSLLGVGLVETLRTNLELEVFHKFEDMVVALVDGEVEVAKGVVALLIVYIE